MYVIAALAQHFCSHADKSKCMEGFQTIPGWGPYDGWQHCVNDILRNCICKFQSSFCVPYPDIFAAMQWRVHGWKGFMTLVDDWVATVCHKSFCYWENDDIWFEFVGNHGAQCKIFLIKLGGRVVIVSSLVYSYQIANVKVDRSEFRISVSTTHFFFFCNQL